MRSIRGLMTNCAIAQPAATAISGAVSMIENRVRDTVISHAAAMIAATIPEMKTAGKTRPMRDPARDREGNTANAAGATTAATRIAAPSQRASTLSSMPAANGLFTV